MKGAGLFFAAIVVVVFSSVCFGFAGGFIENVGQVDGAVRYYAHGSGVSVYFTDRGVVLDIRQREAGGVGGGVDRWSEVGIDRPDMLGEGGLVHGRDGSRVRGLEAGEGLEERVRGCAVYIYFEGGSGNVEVEGRGELGTRYNYFIGSDRGGWRTGVRAYNEVVYRGVWEGVDLVYRVEGGELEYEVIGEHLGLVRFRYEGAERVVEGDGIVELETVVGRLVEEREGERGILRLAGEVGEGAQGLPDPADRPALLLWSTFLGGGDWDHSFSLVLDGSGNPVVTGVTWSADFPTTPGAYDTTENGEWFDVFVAKLSSSGDSLLWGTFLGGSYWNEGWSLVLDGSGNPVVTGGTASSDFPTTPGAYDTTFNSGWCDVFVAKLSSSGDSLLWSTFLGGSDADWGYSLVLDGSGNPVVTGETWSFNFPRTPGAYDTTYDDGSDVFVAKLSSSGDSLLWSTFLGGRDSDEGNSIVLDGSGNPVVTGYTHSSNFPTTPGAYDGTHNGGDSDVFVAKLSSSGDSLLWGTFLGGNYYDEGYSLVLDALGNPVVTGGTLSSDFPTTPDAYDTTHNGGYDVFVAKLSSSGSNLLWSTFLGGSNWDEGYSLVLDASGDPVLTGYAAFSDDFPTTPGAYDRTHNGDRDVFVAKLSSSGSSLLWSTLLGGGGSDGGYSLILDASGNPVLTGVTGSSDFPTSAGAYDTMLSGWYDVFVLRLSKLQADERQIPEQGEPDYSENPGEETAGVLPDGLQTASSGLFCTSFPNPFTAGTRVYFSVSQSEQVSIRIYDVKGELVRMLIDGRYNSGSHEVIWEGRGDDGREVASGVYFIQIEAGTRKQTQRVVILR